MIVGNGLLARSFHGISEAIANATIFASGVSNSQETHAMEFEREGNLLRAHLLKVRSIFVYFSTCSIADPDRSQTDYIKHKLAMESLVRKHPRYLIFRLPQVVGKTENPHTLTNFLARKIRLDETFTVWATAQRNLIDVEHVAQIIREIIYRNRDFNQIMDLASPESVSMLTLVNLMESILRRTARYQIADKGGESTPNSELALRIGRYLGIDFSPGYTERILRKYYGR